MRLRKRETRLPLSVEPRAGVGKSVFIGCGRHFRQSGQFIHLDDPLGRKDRFAFCMLSAEVLASAHKRLTGVIVRVFGMA